MAHDFTSTIEDEVNRASLSVIDLIQVNFGAGIERRWSTVRIPASAAPNLTGEYEPRLVSLGSRRWSVGADDDSVSLVLGNADDEIRNFARSYGLDIFEGAKVRHHRLFPSIKEVYFDYWVGKGSSMRFEELTGKWEVRFGLAALKQRALRRYQRNCPHVFAGGLGSDCPYKPTKGYGIPRPVLFGDAALGTNNNRLVDATANIFEGVHPGLLVYNRSRNCVSEIIQVTSSNQLELTDPVKGAGTDSVAGWQAGDKYVVGPPYTSCEKTATACNVRGMFGPTNGNVEGVMDERKYFGGFNDVANVVFQGKRPEDGSRFVRNTLGNNSFDGQPIPVIFGTTKIFGIEALAHTNEGRFQGGIFVLCEGQILDISNVVVNERLPDDVGVGLATSRIKDRGVGDADASVAVEDSFIKYGVWYPRGIDDSRVMDVPAELQKYVAKHVRGLYGARSAVAVRHGNRIIDRYSWVGMGGRIQVTNPHLFVDGNGGGVSLHGLAAVRIRIDTNEDDDSVLNGDFLVHGLLTPLHSQMPYNVGRDSIYNLPKSPADSIEKYTAYPNVVQAAYAFLTNTRWGAGLSPALLDIDSFVRESNYCEEDVDDTAFAARTKFDGYVNLVPAWKVPQLDANSWFFSESITTQNQNSDFDPENFGHSLVNRTITFNPHTPGRAFTATILAAFFVKNPVISTIDSLAPGGNDPNNPEESQHPIVTLRPSIFDEVDNPYTAEASGFVVRIDEQVPQPGTPFIISGGHLARYKANGMLADDISAVEMLQSILDNCHGIFRTTKGKLEIIIKKELSPTEIEDILSNRLFTDRGSNRNILQSNNTSTVRVWREDTEDIINSYSVEFLDSSRDYKTSRLVIYDDAAQIRAATRLGELGDRRQISESVKLVLTSDIGQAKRLLALRAREEIIQNLFCSFSTSLKQGMQIEPGDIIAVDSNEIIGSFNVSILGEDVVFGDSFLFRVTEKVESDAYTINFTCKLHVNGIYSDIVRDYGDFSQIFSTSAQKAGIVAFAKPETPEESTYIDQYGFPQSQIRVKVTFPDL